MANTNTVAAYPGVLEVAGMVISPNGGQVNYVGTAAQQAALGQTGEAIASRSFLTINQALANCITGRGDYIYVLPGYTENITAANAWSSWAATDVTICGLGHGTNRPSITWTANAATLTLTVANSRILNCRMFLAGPQVNGTALTIAAPITISAAGCEISDCEIWWGFDADQIVTIGITTTAAADNLTFNRNVCYAETAAVPTTTFLRLTGVDNLVMTDTFIVGPGSTTAIGPVQQLTTAGLKSKITNSIFQNTLASSTISFTAIAGCTGTMHLCSLGVLAAGNGITTGSGIQVTGTWVAVAGAAGTLATG